MKADRLPQEYLDWKPEGKGPITRARNRWRKVIEGLKKNSYKYERNGRTKKFR